MLWNLAFFNMIRGDLALVREQTATLMRQAEQAGRPAFLMAVASRRRRGVGVHRRLRRVEPAARAGARAPHAGSSTRAYNAMFGIDPGMVARAMSSRPLWALGYPDRAHGAQRARPSPSCRSQRQPVTLRVRADRRAGHPPLSRRDRPGDRARRRDRRALPRVRVPAGSRVGARLPGFGDGAAGAHRGGRGAAARQPRRAARPPLGADPDDVPVAARRMRCCATGAPTRGSRSSTKGSPTPSGRSSAGSSPSCTGCAASCCCCRATRRRPKPACGSALDVSRQQQARSFELRAATLAGAAAARVRTRARRARGARARLPLVHRRAGPPRISSLHGHCCPRLDND